MSAAEHLRVIETETSWGIYSPLYNVPQLYCSPAEALAKLILDPRQWPDDVDFWLDLCDGGAMRSDTLGAVWDGMKRPYFEGVLMIRHNLRAGLDLYDFRPRTHVDFWFLGKFVEVLRKHDFRFMSVADEAADHMLLFGMCWPSLEELSEHLVIRRKGDWRKNFLMIRDLAVLRWLGVKYGQSEGHNLLSMTAW